MILSDVRLEARFSFTARLLKTHARILQDLGADFVAGHQSGSIPVRISAHGKKPFANPALRGRPPRAASKKSDERHPSLLQGPRLPHRDAARCTCSLHSAPSDFTRCDCET